MDKYPPYLDVFSHEDSFLLTPFTDRLYMNTCSDELSVGTHLSLARGIRRIEEIRFNYIISIKNKCSEDLVIQAICLPWHFLTKLQVVILAKLDNLYLILFPQGNPWLKQTRTTGSQKIFLTGFECYIAVMALKKRHLILFITVLSMHHTKESKLIYSV